MKNMIAEISSALTEVLITDFFDLKLSAEQIKAFVIERLELTNVDAFTDVLIDSMIEGGIKGRNEAQDYVSSTVESITDEAIKLSQL